MIKYIDEFRNRDIISALVRKVSGNKMQTIINIMEVCGGHTYSIVKYGINELLPDNIKLKSGPGCPVCVTSQDYIDKAIELANVPNTIITTFGDLLKVPGSESSLLRVREQGKDIRVCLSCQDAMDIAVNNPGKEIIFLGIGFETTSPSIAVCIRNAKSKNINNFSVLSSLKTMPEVMSCLLIDPDINIDAFICPGHVSAITGYGIYEDIVRVHKKPCVITGFEPLDILMSIEFILRQISTGEIKIENQYSRTVREEGNLTARRIVSEVFEPSDSYWRGIGEVKNSGLAIRDEFAVCDAFKKFSIGSGEVKDNPRCICGEILKGKNDPIDCKLFAVSCTLDNPIGACMVSAEGSCAIYYKFRKMNTEGKNE